MFDTSKSIVQNISLNPLGLNTNIFVKRDDLIDPIVSGNKWRKLKYAFLKAQVEKKDTIITFGGAFSNHLIATAKAGKIFQFKTIGIVRGDELNKNSNTILQQCDAFGMELKFISRQDYLLREDKAFLNDLHVQHHNAIIIPEGGASVYGTIGCQEIWKEINGKNIEKIILAAGTGTTACGLLLGAPQNTKIYCVPVLAGNFMRNNIKNLLYQVLFDEDLVEEKLSHLEVLDNYHFGKYANTTPELIQFISEVNQQLQLPLDKIYTGKAFYALVDCLRNGRFPAKNTMFLHTGGLNQ